MSDAPRCPPDLTLERHLAGELARGSAEAVHVLDCARCRQRLATMKSEGDAYLASPDAAAVRRKLATPARTGRPIWLRPWTVAAPLVAAAAAWVVMTRAPRPSDLAPKGQTVVQILVGHEGRVAPWAGAALSPGDVLQLSWTSPRSAYVAVVGREDSGATTRCFPASDVALRLEPSAHEFGDGLRFDPPFQGTFFVFIADGAFPVAPLEDAIRGGRIPPFAGETRALRIPPAR